MEAQPASEVRCIIKKLYDGQGLKKEFVTESHSIHRAYKVELQLNVL
jgi:hypothetical protein